MNYEFSRQQTSFLFTNMSCYYGPVICTLNIKVQSVQFFDNFLLYTLLFLCHLMLGLLNVA